MGSFLNTENWLEFQKYIGRKGERFDNGKIVANIIILDTPIKKNLIYIPHGPELRVNRLDGGLKNEIRNFIRYLKEMAEENKAIYIKMEPLEDWVAELMVPQGFKRSRKEVQASRSVILDLGRPEEEILTGMHHKTRYNIRVAEKNSIRIESSNDVEVLWNLLNKTSKRQKFHAHPKAYYKKLFEFFKDNPGIKSEIILAWLGDKPVAGVFLLTHGDTCYYLHGGSDYDYHNVMAPYALHWHVIKELNKKGIKHYDFGGSESVKWAGITRFKLGWGGRQIEYPGSFDLPVSKFWYLAYNAARKILRK